MRRSSSKPTASAARRAALALLALGAGCASPNRAECPGVDLGTLSVTGAISTAGCALGSEPAAGLAALYPPSVAFRATLAYASQGSGASLCLDRDAAVPFAGTRAAVPGGERIDVSLDTSGAVLSACASDCSVQVRQQVAGVVTRDPVSGAITGFDGTLTETDTAVGGGACAPCVLPCGATWALALAP